MFERFTERARKVVVLAQEEARHFNHNYIGTEHLLLGLLREDEGVAARALSSLNVTLDEVCRRVESIVGCGEEGTGGQAPFTPRSKKVLELALREALQLGHDYIGTEHILLGLVQEPRGVAVQVLFSLNAGPEAIRRRVNRMLSDGGEKINEGANRTADLSRIFAFWTRVEGLMIQAHCGVTEEERAMPQSLRVDLRYSYEVGEGEGLSNTANYSAVIEGVVGLLEREEFRLLETGARMVGEHVLGRFPSVREVTITITKPKVSVAREVSGVSVEATFSR